MYQLVFGSPDSHMVLAEGNNLEQVMAQRTMTGDLLLWCERPFRDSSRVGGSVIETVTTVKRICTFDDWLFEWEKQDPTCYARRCQREGWRY